MLKVYAAKWCPHCARSVAFLKERDIPFEYYEIEEQPEETVKRVVEANGGEDWVVPTMEFNGRWRPGKVFDPDELEKDLKEMGVL